jgi:hypothetical protein
VQNTTDNGRETIDALAASIDQAMHLLRRGRYRELGEHLAGFEQQAEGLQALRQALEAGSAPPLGVRESCERLGQRLVVFSQVARQVAAVESGVVQLLAEPRDSSYGRDGQPGNGAALEFQQEA